MCDEVQIRWHSLELRHTIWIALPIEKLSWIEYANQMTMQTDVTKSLILVIGLLISISKTSTFATTAEWVNEFDIVDMVDIVNIDFDNFGWHIDYISRHGRHPSTKLVAMVDSLLSSGRQNVSEL